MDEWTSIRSRSLFDYPKVATHVGATIIVVSFVDRFPAAVNDLNSPRGVERTYDTS